MKNLFVVVVLALAAIGQDGTVFRVGARLVEVYATVRDERGKYLDGLTQDKFQIRDNGEVQTPVVFESNAERLSCAVLLDTTGSMVAALPLVKSAVMRMIDELRDGDTVAIYTFNTALSRVQDFTEDRAVAKQAVLRSRASGATALFDAVSGLARDIEPRNGKKAIVVFTDGNDNASLLNSRAAVQRAKRAGIPVYAIAEGDARKSKELLTLLKDVSETTGARMYEVQKTQEITKVFEEITDSLQHTYMLAYKPPSVTDQRWRTVELSVLGMKGAKVRAKEGYLP